MAQPSVAREPSMEEILASIRRIIESNEPGIDGAGEALTQDERPVAVDAAPQFEDASHPVVADSMGVPLRAANNALPMRDAPAIDKPQSLADIAARVRSAAERPVERPVQSPAQMVPEPSFTQPVAPVFVEPVTQHDVRIPSPAAVSEPQPAHVHELPLRAALQLQPLAPEIQPVSVAPTFGAASISAAGAMISGFEAERQSHPVSFTPPAQEPVVYEEMAVLAAAPAYDTASTPQAEALPDVSLLSNEAGAMVARSFGELAEAVDGAQRRSLDEIASDLLRPMLREWLDDNLPTLVERLVREEIERVSRGPRR